jgi:hypothetical protein
MLWYLILNEGIGFEYPIQKIEGPVWIRKQGPNIENSILKYRYQYPAFISKCF